MSTKVNRKRKLRQYFVQNLSFDLATVDELKRQPQAQIRLMGGIRSWYLTTACIDVDANYKEAIAYAGYKFPNSDRTWITAIQTAHEVATEKWDQLDLPR